MIAGVAGFSESLVHRLVERPAAAGRGAAFALVLGVCGVAVHALALMHLAALPVLRVMAGILVAAGCAQIAASAGAASTRIQNARRSWKEASFVERIAFLAVAFAVLGLVLA